MVVVWSVVPVPVPVPVPDPVPVLPEPVAVLPDWVQWVAELNPITHAVRSLQLAIFQGVPLRGLGKELAALTLFAVLLVPLSLGTWRWAFRRARLDGSLSLH